MDKPLLSAEGLSKKYGPAYALSDVTFTLGRGRVLGLFGLNGSGKSTLLDILALASRPDGGKIIFDGAEVSARPGAVRRRIGYVPQEIALFDELTVRENLLCWSRLPGRQALLRAQELAETLNLTAFFGKKVSALSGGMKKRVNLAVALLGSPELLILDEPFAGVDAENCAGILQFLGEKAAAGTAQIISGHSAEQLMPLMTDVMVLSLGKILYLGEKDAFLAQTEHGDAGAVQRLLRGVAL